MAQLRQIDSYSIAAHICMALAICGGCVLMAVTVTSMYFIR